MKKLIFLILFAFISYAVAEIIEVPLQPEAIAIDYQGVTLTGVSESPYSVCDDANLLGYWAFTSDANESCGTSAKNLTETAAPESYGVDGALFEADNSDKLTLAGGLGYDWDDANTISIVARLQCPAGSDAGASAMAFAAEYNTTDARVFAAHIQTGDSVFKMSWGNTAGTGSDAQVHGSAITEDDTPYWILYQLDDDVGNALATIRVRTVGPLADYGTDIVSQDSGEDWTDEDNPDFLVGTIDGSAWYWDCYLRDLMIFKDLLSEAEFENIVNTYE